MEMPDFFVDNYHEKQFFKFLPFDQGKAGLLQHIHEIVVAIEKEI